MWEDPAESFSYKSEEFSENEYSPLNAEKYQGWFIHAGEIFPTLRVSSKSFTIPSQASNGMGDTITITGVCIIVWME